MKIFLDISDPAIIEKWAKKGIIDGVTTNPSLLSKQQGVPKDIIKKICSVMAGKPVSVQVTKKDPEEVYLQAKEIAALADNVVVKIPCQIDYYSVIERLAKEGIKINATLIFSLVQGLCMCKLGASYISPFVGRIDDIGQSGINLVENLRSMIDDYVFKTEIIAASIRSVKDFDESILECSNIATLPPAVLEKALYHPLTEQGIEKFDADWQKLNVNIFP